MTRSHRTLVVLGDSLAFNGTSGPENVNHPKLFTNLLLERLREHTGEQWEGALIVRASWSVVYLADALRTDLHLIQQVLPSADIVLLGVGSLDSLPVGLPTGFLRAMATTRRPLLRRVFKAMAAPVHPILLRVTGERLRHTRRDDYMASWRLCVERIRQAAPESALLFATLPTVHQSNFWGTGRRHHAQTVADTQAMAAELDIPLVDVPGLIDGDLSLLADDRLHWGWEMHERAAAAMFEVVRPHVGRGR